jgi:hypothetical protein
LERSTHRSRPGKDGAECLDGEGDLDGEAGDTTIGGKLDADRADTVELEPVKWSRDIDADDGEGTERLVGKVGVAEKVGVGKLVREGRLEIVADKEEGLVARWAE